MLHGSTAQSTGPTFVAFDTELANPKYQSLCSIGFAFVTNGEITDRKHFYVQPSKAYHFFTNTHLHGISKEHTAQAPTLDVLWSQIEKHFTSGTIIAHNASFDLAVLRHSLEVVGLSLPKVDSECTSLLSKRHFPEIGNGRLADVMRHLQLELKNHHSAVDDAVACAKVYLSLYQRVGENLTVKSPKRRSGSSSGSEAFFRSKQKGTANTEGIEWHELDLTDTNILRGKKVVVTGEFEAYTREALQEVLEDWGATLNSSISHKTNFVLIGDDPGPAKMTKLVEIQRAGHSVQAVHQDAFIEWLDAQSNEVTEDLTTSTDAWPAPVDLPITSATMTSDRLEPEPEASSVLQFVESGDRVEAIQSADFIANKTFGEDPTPSPLPPVYTPAKQEETPVQSSFWKRVRERIGF